MKKVAFVIYRKWAFDIYTAISQFQKDFPHFEIELVITTAENEYQDKNNHFHILEGKDGEKAFALLKEHKIDIVFYYGWSWMIKEPILNEFLCICLHPSPLPLYRGGSPIQHQIINGEKTSAVSLFKIKVGIDDGDLYAQTPLSLKGDLKKVFSEISLKGVKLTKQLLVDFVAGGINFYPQQNLEKNPPLKRRKKEDSEITLEKIKDLTFLNFYNLVRALDTPYPNMYITFDNYRLLLQEIFFQRILPDEKICLLLSRYTSMDDFDGMSIYIKVSNGYAKLVRYTFELGTAKNKSHLS